MSGDNSDINILGIFCHVFFFQTFLTLQNKTPNWGNILPGFFPPNIFNPPKYKSQLR